ncbi:Hypothetical protein CINCED_3A022358 [Cinara cedri]|uniref:Uncharacterized protein n=1 Tax=Cinara cedri TaxID=506608 RepID=A0A5E4N0S7_9HEMI|nr:Hypothetical protein CINCED_3A022358 [Cinara cedri]
MTKPNTDTENILEKNTENEKPNEKSSTLHNHPIFVEYCNAHLLYPIAELEKWKKKLQIMRSRTDNQFKTNIIPLKRLTDDEPLHEVFRNIMDKELDIFPVDDERVTNKTPAAAEENQKSAKNQTENEVKSVPATNYNVSTVNYEIWKTSVPVQNKKPNQSNASTISENANCLIAEKKSVQQVINNATLTNNALKPSKKKIKIRKDTAVVHVDKKK